MAADLSAPSFSLGVDLDSDDDQQEQQDAPSIANPSNQQQQEEGLDLDQTLDRDEPRRPVLNRLRRGPPPPAPPPPVAAGGNEDWDDDIEDFSSQETDDGRFTDISPSLPSHSTCSSSKVPLHYRGVLSSQPASKLKTQNISAAYHTSASQSFGASSSKSSFPRVIASPVRKIHLLDSDSDDPTASKVKGNENVVDASNKKRKCFPFKSTISNEEEIFQLNKRQTESFRKDFSPKKNINLATPALDEFCEEYFKSANNQKFGQQKDDVRSLCSSRVIDPDDFVDEFEGFVQQTSSSSKPDHSWNSPSPRPPAYQYFFNEDARIRALVRERLCYFVPLGAESHSGTQQPGMDNLDYIGQFSHGDGPSQARGAHKKGPARTSNIKGNKRRTANSKTDLHASEGWVNPRSSAVIPKDASKRRVSAVGSQSGHWFTGQDGRKVYISKNGEELTGRNAYRQYKKENGNGFQKGKKKAAAKKKKR